MPSALPFDLKLARQVKTDSLTPCQQKTTPGFKTATDYRVQHMLKHPFLSQFHSRAEHLMAGLLEGNRAVTSYVPQPFLVWIGKRRYTPDGYIVSDDAPRTVYELKPRGEFPDERRIPLEHFFAQYGMPFEVYSNESIYERELEAENWLEIVRILHLARDYETTDAEQHVLEQLFKKGPCTLGDLIDPGDRERTYPEEIALFRLLHRGHLMANLAEKPLNFDTEFSSCT